ncbi:hypothetical protein HYX10_04910 [Candidatus Woesearchaeota archaeon]|nr:hypothetical protein [Candidatus Woesearchaeota archaeon]
MCNNQQRTAIFLLCMILAASVASETAFASSHYTFEHAEEMRVSGRIEWRDYGPDAFN